MRDFIVESQTSTPLVPDRPGEYLDYLSFKHTPHDSDFPLLQTLGHEEWLTQNGYFVVLNNGIEFAAPTSLWCSCFSFSVPTTISVSTTGNIVA